MSTNISAIPSSRFSARRPKTKITPQCGARPLDCCKRLDELTDDSAAFQGPPADASASASIRATRWSAISDAAAVQLIRS